MSPVVSLEFPVSFNPFLKRNFPSHFIVKLIIVDYLYMLVIIINGDE